MTTGSDTPGATGPHIPGLADFELIGWGGFGAVFRAFQPSLNRHVAVKVLSTASLDEKVRRRFDREQRAMGSLSSHPAIVTLHGSGFTQEGLPYLVMELMEGGSLADRLGAQGPMGWQQAVDITVRIAGAVEEAHHAGVLHRDIKPENILMSRYGEPKLTDFGIASLMEGTATATTTVTATVEHAAPEVLAGRQPTVAADVYSLASTLFCLLAGHSPFRRSPEESVLPILSRVANESAPDLRPRGVPEQVCRALEAGLAKDPAERTQTAAGFANALQEAARQAGESPASAVASALAGVVFGAPLQGTASTSAPSDSGRTRALEYPVEQPAQPEEQAPRRLRRWVVAAVILLVLGGAAGAFFMLDGGDEDQSAATTLTSLQTTAATTTTAAPSSTAVATTATHATTTTRAPTTTSATTTTTRAPTTTSSTTTSSTTTTTTTTTTNPVQVGVSPGSVSAGTMVTITATGLTHGGAVSFAVFFPSGGTAWSDASKTADGSGAAVARPVPQQAWETGTYSIRVTDNSSGRIGWGSFVLN